MQVEVVAPQVSVLVPHPDTRDVLRFPSSIMLTLSCLLALYCPGIILSEPLLLRSPGGAGRRKTSSPYIVFLFPTRQEALVTATQRRTHALQPEKIPTIESQ